jgi:hypothetical protein
MMDMKIQYVKPEAEILEFDLDVYMLSTSDDMNIEDDGDAEDGEEAASNRYRGEWGNLWAN